MTGVRSESVRGVRLLAGQVPFALNTLGFDCHLRNLSACRLRASRYGEPRRSVAKAGRRTPRTTHGGRHVRPTADATYDRSADVNVRIDLRTSDPIPGDSSRLLVHP